MTETTRIHRCFKRWCLAPWAHLQILRSRCAYGASPGRRIARESRLVLKGGCLLI
jgi:hypothetical protein